MHHLIEKVEEPKTCSSAPDTSGLNNAAQQNAQLGQESLDWFENYMNQTQGQRDQTSALDNQIAGQQVAGMQLANQSAEDQADQTKNVYEPLDDKLVTDAQNYDTAGRRDAAANGAMSDVAQQLAVQQGANNRALSRTGIAPGSAKSESMNADMSLAGALGQQQAAAGARQNVENTGHAMEMDAAGLGKGVVANETAALQAGSQAGSSAAGTSGNALSAATSAAPLMQTGYGQAMQGNQIAGNLYGQAAQLSMAQGNSMMAGIGGIAGLAGQFMQSSKKVKQNKKPMDGKAALDAVNNLKVEAWDYKPGEGDGGTHVGPYAEDVQREMGNEIAPGGKKISIPGMAHVNAQALQHITAEIAKVEAQIKALEAA